MCIKLLYVYFLPPPPTPTPLSPSPTHVQVSWLIKAERAAPQGPKSQGGPWSGVYLDQGWMPFQGGMWGLAGKGRGGPRVPQQVVSSPYPATRKSRKVVERAQKDTPQPTNERVLSSDSSSGPLWGGTETSEGRSLPPPCADGTRPHPPRRPLPEQHPLPHTHPQRTGLHTAGT